MPRHTTEIKWCAVALKKYTQFPDREIAEKLNIKPREIQRIYSRYKTYGDVKDRSGGDQKSLARLGADYFLKRPKKNKDKDKDEDSKDEDKEKDFTLSLKTEPYHCQENENAEEKSEKKKKRKRKKKSDQKEDKPDFIRDRPEPSTIYRPPSPGDPATPASLNIFSPPPTPFQLSIQPETPRSVEGAGSVFVTPMNPPVARQTVITTSLVNSATKAGTTTTTGFVPNKKPQSSINIITCNKKTFTPFFTAPKIEKTIVPISTVPMIAHTNNNVSYIDSMSNSSLTQELLKNPNLRTILEKDSDIDDRHNDETVNNDEEDRKSNKSSALGSDQLSFDIDENDEDERSEPETLPSTHKGDDDDDENSDVNMDDSYDDEEDGVEDI